MGKSTIELLRERIERNYAEFKAETLLNEAEDIYSMAGKIAAVEDTYYQLTTYGYEYLEEEEAEYLLKFYNPLEMVADFLEERVKDQPVEMDEALYELFEREDNEERYVTAELAEELKQKYGADVIIEIAILTETIGVLEQYVRLLKLSRSEGKTHE